MARTTSTGAQVREQHSSEGRPYTAAVGYRHSSDEILDAARAVALESGMAGMTFGSVGARLGISDRTVVYYYSTKHDLIAAVAMALGAELQALLEVAFGSEPNDADVLLHRAWPVLSSGDADRIFAVFFEVIGLASAGQEPYVDLARGMVDAWAEWLAPRVRGSTPAIRRRRALALMAQVDGLLLLRQVAGAEVADAAARELGADS
jgi:AcrR family transcriptional regulator